MEQHEKEKLELKEELYEISRKLYFYTKQTEVDTVFWNITYITLNQIDLLIRLLDDN